MVLLCRERQRQHSITRDAASKNVKLALLLITSCFLIGDLFFTLACACTCGSTEWIGPLSMFDSSKNGIFRLI